MKTFVVGQKILYKGQHATVRRTSILNMSKTSSLQIVIDETGQIINLLRDKCEECECIDEHDHE